MFSFCVRLRVRSLTLNCSPSLMRVLIGTHRVRPAMFGPSLSLAVAFRGSRHKQVQAPLYGSQSQQCWVRLLLVPDSAALPRNFLLDRSLTVPHLILLFPIFPLFLTCWLLLGGPLPLIFASHRFPACAAQTPWSLRASPGQNRYSGSPVSSSGLPGTRGLALSGWPRCHHGVLAQAGRGIGFCSWLERIPIQAASHTPPPPGLRQPQPGKVQGLRTGKGWEVASVDVMFVIPQRRVQRNVQHVEYQGAEAIYLRGFGLIALEFLLSLSLAPSYILHSAVFF